MLIGVARPDSAYIRNKRLVGTYRYIQVHTRTISIDIETLSQMRQYAHDLQIAYMKSLAGGGEEAVPRRRRGRGR